MAITVVVVGADRTKGSHVRFLSFSRLPWLIDTVSQYINFEPYDESKTYDRDTVFLILAGVYHEYKDQFKDRRVIVDVCLEAMMPVWDELYQLKEPHHVILYGSVPVQKFSDVIFVPNFFWYNESLQNLTRGYQNYQPNRNYSKKFLMPIGRKVSWRDRVVELLDPYLDDAYWSYVRRGTALPGEPPETAGAKRWDTRYQNPMWYDDTCFGLVLESVTRWESAVPFLTEKIFKPISHYQPYMVIGANGILQYLKQQGFETFDNVFDESYDQVSSLDDKMKIIIDNIERYQKQPHDRVTLGKLKHNFELFYNVDRIRQDIVKSFVEPIEQYVNS